MSGFPLYVLGATNTTDNVEGLNGFKKTGLDDTHFLLAGGGSTPTANYLPVTGGNITGGLTIQGNTVATQSWVTSQNYLTSSDLVHKFDYSGGQYNASDSHTNKSWFDYNWAGSGRVGSVINFSGLGGNYSTELFAAYDYSDFIGIRSKHGDINIWNPVKWLWHSGNFNPANYVQQSSLNTTLENYVTKNGVQDITATKTFTVSPIVPNGTLGNHAVNLEQLNTEIDNIQIGGRNLVIDSTNPNRLPIYGVTATVTKVADNNLSKFKTVFSNITRTAGDYVFFIPFGNMPEIFSQNLSFIPTIISFYIRSNSDQVLASGNFSVSIDSNWKKIELPYTYGGSGNLHFLVSGANLQWVEIHSYKIEKGNKATDWTPAPEDQVADWNQTDATAFNFIKNKPTSLPPTAHTHVISDVTGLETALANKENAFAKNTAFNKNFGTTAGTVAEGNHTHSGYLNQGLNIDVSAESNSLRINPIEIFLDGSGVNKFDGSEHPHRLVYIILSDGASGLSLENLQPKQRIVIFNISGNTIGINEDIAPTQYILPANYKVSVYKIQNSYYSANSAIFYDKTGLTIW